MMFDLVELCQLPSNVLQNTLNSSNSFTVNIEEFGVYVEVVEPEEVGEHTVLIETLAFREDDLEHIGTYNIEIRLTVVNSSDGTAASNSTESDLSLGSVSTDTDLSSTQETQDFATTPIEE